MVEERSTTVEIDTRALNISAYVEEKFYWMRADENTLLWAANSAEDTINLMAGWLKENRQKPVIQRTIEYLIKNVDRRHEKDKPIPQIAVPLIDKLLEKYENMLEKHDYVMMLSRLAAYK